MNNPTIERAGIEIKGSVALVTGSNRGLGAAFCPVLAERDAATVYAGARDGTSIRREPFCGVDR